MDTLERLQEIFRKVFDDTTLTISRQTAPQDIESWDWEHHAMLIFEVENSWGLSFSISKIAYLRTAGDIIDLIESKKQRSAPNALVRGV